MISPGIHWRAPSLDLDLAESSRGGGACSALKMVTRQSDSTESCPESWGQEFVFSAVLECSRANATSGAVESWVHPRPAWSITHRHRGVHKRLSGRAIPLPGASRGLSPCERIRLPSHRDLRRSGAFVRTHDEDVTYPPLKPPVTRASRHSWLDGGFNSRSHPTTVSPPPPPRRRSTAGGGT